MSDLNSVSIGVKQEQTRAAGKPPTLSVRSLEVCCTVCCICIYLRDDGTDYETCWRALSRVLRFQFRGGAVQHSAVCLVLCANCIYLCVQGENELGREMHADALSVFSFQFAGGALYACALCACGW